jgi:hypothetical protein
LKIEDIEKLCGAAEDGPWNYKGMSGYVINDQGTTMAIAMHKNGEFIAASRELMPKLLQIAKQTLRAKQDGQLTCSLDDDKCPACEIEKIFREMGEL